MWAILRNRPYGAWEWKIARTEHGMEIVRAIHELPIRNGKNNCPYGIVGTIHELSEKNRPYGAENGDCTGDS